MLQLTKSLEGAQTGYAVPPAMNRPPLKPCGRVKKLVNAANVAPLNAVTCGPPPGPAAVRMAGVPLPPYSPLKATRTPPVKPAPRA